MENKKEKDLEQVNNNNPPFEVFLPKQIIIINQYHEEPEI